jgi:hypothetical protein
VRNRASPRFRRPRGPTGKPATDGVGVFGTDQRLSARTVGDRRVVQRGHSPDVLNSAVASVTGLTVTRPTGPRTVLPANPVTICSAGPAGASAASLTATRPTHRLPGQLTSPTAYRCLRSSSLESNDSPQASQTFCFWSPTSDETTGVTVRFVRKRGESVGRSDS